MVIGVMLWVELNKPVTEGTVAKFSNISTLNCPYKLLDSLLARMFLMVKAMAPSVEG